MYYAMGTVKPPVGFVYDQVGTTTVRDVGEVQLPPHSCQPEASYGHPALSSEVERKPTWSLSYEAPISQSLIDVQKYRYWPPL